MTGQGTLVNWLRAYRVRHYVRNSIWILPVLGMLGAIGCVRLLYRVDKAIGWESSFQSESARALFSTLASSVFTLVVFVSSALLVAVQLVSSQLTPRIIAIVFKDPVTKYCADRVCFHVHALTCPSCPDQRLRARDHGESGRLQLHGQPRGLSLPDRSPGQGPTTERSLAIRGHTGTRGDRERLPTTRDGLGRHGG